MPQWQKEHARLPLFARIAIGVCLGTLAASAIQWGASLWMLRAAAKSAADDLRNRTEQAQREVAVATRQAMDLAEAKKAQAARAQQAAAADKKLLEDEENRKALAWSRFYKKPVACDDTRGGSWSVDCANDYVRKN